MEKHIIFIFFYYFLLRSISPSTADDNCRPASCGPNEPTIRFPFRLIGRQLSTCGFPGFDLSCNKQNQTIIRLPSSPSYTVKRINYLSQIISIDHDFCIPNEINSFSLTNTPFDLTSTGSYTFYNCTSQNFDFMNMVTPFPCLSSANHSVFAVETGYFPRGNMTGSCELMKTIQLPVMWGGEISSEFELMWYAPSCRRCEMDGKGCGFVNEYGDTGCIDTSHGFPTSAKYGLSLGIGVPASIAIIALICYTTSRARDNNITHNQGVELFSIAVIPQPRSRSGLGGLIIESYPKTTLGESCRLPASDDSTCAICLSDYKAKESLRTIPECNHYFHADCIDEWLKLNGTCPVCRNSPESSSLVTTCCSVSTTLVDSS